jgi:hypothetical protein
MAEALAEYMKPGHRFDTGPFLLDLYRLFGIVLGDRQLAEMERSKYSAIELLRSEYAHSELIRIVTSTAIALRILFDQHRQPFTNVSQRPCGELFVDWPTPNPVDLTLREACNKIIHARKVNYDEVDPDPGYNSDQIGVYLRPYVHLYGKKDACDWKATLSIIDFAKFAATVFQRFHH